jgi:hypothetical protein
MTSGLTQKLNQWPQEEIMERDALQKSNFILKRRFMS